MARHAIAVGVLIVTFIARTSLILAQQQTQPSLGEIAKKAAEEREKAKAAGTLTDSPLGHRSPLDETKTAPPPPAKDAKTTDGKKVDAKSDAKSDEKTEEKGETYWRDRMKTLRTSCQAKAAAVKSFEEIEKTKIADARKELAACASCPQNVEITVTLPAVIQVEIEKAKADLSACNATISIAEEEARVAGVPPGWLREKR